MTPDELTDELARIVQATMECCAAWSRGGGEFSTDRGAHRGDRPADHRRDHVRRAPGPRRAHALTPRPFRVMSRAGQPLHTFRTMISAS